MTEWSIQNMIFGNILYNNSSFGMWYSIFKDLTVLRCLGFLFHYILTGKDSKLDSLETVSLTFKSDSIDLNELYDKCDIYLMNI